jgi:hypothetical protein
MEHKEDKLWRDFLLRTHDRLKTVERRTGSLREIQLGYIACLFDLENDAQQLRKIYSDNRESYRNHIPAVILYQGILPFLCFREASNLFTVGKQWYAAMQTQWKATPTRMELKPLNFSFNITCGCLAYGIIFLVSFSNLI